MLKRKLLILIEKKKEKYIIIKFYDSKCKICKFCLRHLIIYIYIYLCTYEVCDIYTVHFVLRRETIPKDFFKLKFIISLLLFPLPKIDVFSNMT